MPFTRLSRLGEGAESNSQGEILYRQILLDSYVIGYQRIQGISPDNDQSIRKKKEEAWIQEYVKSPLFEQKVGVFKANEIG
jgi:hypothetical protein